MSTATQPQPQTIDLAEIAKVDPVKALELSIAETNRAKKELGEMKLLTQMKVGKEGLEATNSQELWWLAGIYALSGAAPKDDTDVKFQGQWGQRPLQEIKARLFIKMSFGAELGMKPLQSIQNIAVINNRPCIWGDAAKALVINSGFCEYCREEEIGKPGNPNNPDPNWGFICRTKRKGQDQEESYTFTWGDAKMAGLIDKNGSLYKLYPKRMLMFRARGFRLRDTYPDVLKGLITAEEARDIDNDRDVKEHRPSVAELLDGPDETAGTPQPPEHSESQETEQQTPPPEPKQTTGPETTEEPTQPPQPKQEPTPAEVVEQLVVDWINDIGEMTDVAAIQNAVWKIDENFPTATGAQKNKMKRAAGARLKIVQPEVN